MRVIFLNGPPGCGKDTVGRFIQELDHDFVLEKFAQPLRAAACGFYGIDDRQLDDYKREDPKIRQFMIAVSEQVAKRIYGRTYFGAQCAVRANHLIHTGGIVVTDSGFEYEVAHFIEQLEQLRKGMPAATYELWQIQRPGCSFLLSNDSRRWVRLPADVGPTREINNCGNIHHLGKLVKQLLESSEG